MDTDRYRHLPKNAGVTRTPRLSYRCPPVAIGKYLRHYSGVLSPAELGAIARDRRVALGLKQVQVVQRAARLVGDASALSEPTLRAIERGRTNASDRSLAIVSRALDWPPDALRRLRDGEWTYDNIAASAPPETAASHGIDLTKLSRDELKQLQSDIDDVLGES